MPREQRASGAEASGSAGPSGSASGGGAWPQGRGARGNADNRRRRGSQHRFSGDQDWEALLGIPPPYFVAAGYVPGYKVHVGDMPGAWSAENAYAKIVRDVLTVQTIAEPDDVSLEMKPSKRGGRQLMLTWRSCAEAIRAKVAIHDFVCEGVRLNAKYFAPGDYDPWADDERFADVPR